jgi:hypothetical protein
MVERYVIVAHDNFGKHQGRRMWLMEIWDGGRPCYSARMDVGCEY